MFIAVASVWKELYNSKEKRFFFNKLSFRGYIFIVVAVIFIYLNYSRDIKAYKEYNLATHKNDSVQNLLQKATGTIQLKQRELSQLQTSTGDTILKAVSISYQKSMRVVSSALGKYNLTILDSMRQIRFINPNPPELTLASQGAASFGTYEGQKVINIKITSRNNIAYNVSLGFCLISFQQTPPTMNLHLLYCKEVEPSLNYIGQNDRPSYPLIFNPSWSSEKEIFIYVILEFSTDRDNKNKLTHEEAIVFDVQKGKTLGNVTTDNFLEIKKLVETKYMRH